MNKSAISLALALSATASTLSAVTIVNQVGDLSFSYTGGSSEASSTATTLDIQTAKNSYASAGLGASYSFDVGDSITITTSFTLDNSVSDTVSTIDIGFADSATSGSIPFGYDFGVQLDPVTTASGIQFREGSDTNLGKFNADGTFGTTTHTVTFTLERVAVDTYDLTFSSPTISSTTRTVQNDITPLGTTSLDSFYIAFRGNAWTEDFGGSTAVLSLSSFSIDTTADAIPEPSSFALIAGFLGFLSLALRNRRR